MALVPAAIAKDKDKDHDRDHDKHVTAQSRPPGWDKGKKTGWGDCDVPPGQAKKVGCHPGAIRHDRDRDHHVASNHGVSRHDRDGDRRSAERRETDRRAAERRAAERRAAERREAERREHHTTTSASGTTMPKPVIPIRSTQAPARVSRDRR